MTSRRRLAQRQRDTCVLPHLNTCATSYSIKWLDSLEMRFELSSASFTFTFLFLEMPLDTISTQSTGMIAAKCTFKLSHSHSLSLSLASQHLQTAGLRWNWSSRLASFLCVLDLLEPFIMLEAFYSITTLSLF